MKLIMANKSGGVCSTLLAGSIPAVAVIGAASIAAWSAVHSQGEQAKAQLELQKAQFRTQLVLKAAEAPTDEARLANLKFLIEAGLLEDSNHKIASMVARKAPIPFIPSNSRGPPTPLGDCVRPSTDAEWREFQRRHKLPRTGKIDAQTQKSI